jgi:peptidoglycan/xylan/chitin deacetylase (PgdA/CDA1 family)
VAHSEGAGTDVAAAQGSAVATGGTPESSAVRSLIALGRPIYCAAPRGNEVALTFDDGPGPYTQLVMKKLRLHHANATFFDVGRNIDLIAGATRRERALGAVGDHTFTHPLLTSLGPAEAESQIVRTQSALERSTGAPVFLFRPPYGAHDAAIDAIVRAQGMLQILWTVDSADSLGANYAQIERNVIGGLRGGAIILMHENHGQTVRALPNIFGAIRSRHLRAVSVAQLLTDDTPSVAQVRGGGGACGIHGRAGLSGG